MGLLSIVLIVWLLRDYTNKNCNDDLKSSASPIPQLPDYQELYPNATVHDITQLGRGRMYKCYEEIGCVVYTQDFYNLTNRPFNLMPQDRDKIKTQFLLYTLKNIKQYTKLKAGNASSIKASHFDSSKPTKFIIHGFVDTQLFGQWMRDMKDQLLASEDCNVIIVDWSGGNMPPYAQATSNTRVVGLEVGFLINYLMDNHGLTSDKVHILGHSLGAHIAGYAGKIVRLNREKTTESKNQTAEISDQPTTVSFIKDLENFKPLSFGVSNNDEVTSQDAVIIAGQILDPKTRQIQRIEGSIIARITGMDPAGPNFEGMPAIVRLDQTDAMFVDVIHSDAVPIWNLGFGTRDKLGNVDFFPDNGLEHPGCGRIESGLESVILDGVGEGARRFASCDHQRSVDFVVDSINNEQCKMVGFACDSWENFLAGKCADCGENGEKCATLGLNAIDYVPRLHKQANGTTTPTAFYMKTNDKSPFCLFHYQIIMKLRNTSDETTARIYLTIHGSRSTKALLLGDGNIDLNPGETHTFLLTTQEELGNIGAISINWVKIRLGIAAIFTKDKIYLEYIKITPMNTDNRRDQEANTGAFCKHTYPIAPRTQVTMARLSPQECGL